MAQWNDVARTAEPPGYYPDPAPCDTRLRDSAYTHPPAGGFADMGGSSPEKVVQCSIPSTPETPAGVIDTDTGSGASPAVITLSGDFPAGTGISLTATVEGFPEVSVNIDTSPGVDARGAAQMLAANLTASSAIDAVAVGPTVEVLPAAGYSSVVLSQLVVTEAS